MEKQVYKKKEVIEYFEHFTQNIKSNLEKARKLLSKEKLDFSINEIDEIGIIFFKHIQLDNNIGNWYDEMLEIFITYSGEAWMKYFTGNWEICLHKTDTSYRFPIITNWGPDSYPWISIAPIDWARLIKENNFNPLSLPWQRNIRYFNLSPEWNFDPMKIYKNE